ncbi:hypothetical protein CPB85DRAFT_1346535 [Mucidula mucida]|nr:hypothetical protein CPB85DRAFT_1346535 [Mucidula mucida]
MTVELVAHHTGYALLPFFPSSLLSSFCPARRLLTWDVYADSSLGPSKWPANETSFSVTIPPDLGDACKEPGQCAIQWFWYATENSQTYESCIDFTTA